MSRTVILLLAFVCLLATVPASAALISSGGTATQSSTLGAFSADLAINGVMTDFTHTLGNAQDLAPSWQVDLAGGDYNIDQIVVFKRGDGCCPSRLRDITISIRNAADTTTVYTSPLLNPENSLGGPDSLTVNPGVIGGIVRVSRTIDPDNSGNGGVGNSDEGYVLSLGEVQVFGSAVPEPSSLVLLGLGAITGAFGALRRRKLA